MIIALWSLCLLATFAVIIGYQVRQKAMMVKRLDEKESLRYVAQAGVERAIVEVRRQRKEEKTYHSFGEPWSDNSAVFQDIKLGNAACNVYYMHRDDLSGKPRAVYGLIDEERKININRLERSVLEKFFRMAGDLSEIDAQNLAASIVDWRDADSELSTPTGSAEDSYYKWLTYPYAAKNGDFQVLDELLLVKGMDAKLFERIGGYLTPYGSGRVNINTAPRIVLASLGIDSALIYKILLFRYGRDGILGTSDDHFFDMPSNIVPYLSQYTALNASEVAQLSVIVDKYLVTASTHFMIRSSAHMPGKKDMMETVCVVDQEGKILFWQEH